MTCSGEAQRRSSVVIEDVEWLVRSGSNADEITRRLGYRRTNSLYIALRRAGRLDLWGAAMDRMTPPWRADPTRGDGTMGAQEKRSPGAVLARSGFNGGSDRHDCKES